MRVPFLSKQQIFNSYTTTKNNTMNNLTSDQLKTFITNYGVCNINSISVIIVGENGAISFGCNQKSRLEDNEISLHECVFPFFGTFNDDAIESILPELNSLIRNSRIDHFEQTLDMVSEIISKQK